MKIFGLYMSDLAVIALFVYVVFLLTNDMICDTEEEPDCKKIYYVILGLTLLYGVLRAGGFITYTNGVTIRPPTLSPQNFSLGSSRFGLRLGSV